MPSEQTVSGTDRSVHHAVTIRERERENRRKKQWREKNFIIYCFKS